MSIRQQVNELEISRDEVENKLTSIQKQNRSSIDTNKVQSLIETNNHLLQEISILKSNIEQLDQQIQQMDEREQMLLQYPDLNGPMEHEPSKFQKIFYQMYSILFYLATNNIIIDMQNQLRTNEIRIDLLRKQNDSLKSSLEKLLSMNNSHSPPLVTEERYEELRNHSRQEQPYRRYSYGNETVTPVYIFFMKNRFS
jgi:DNA repair exonuclease SbcCD ATPase subunit